MTRLLRKLIRYRPWFVPIRMLAYGSRLRRRLPDWSKVVRRSSPVTARRSDPSVRVLIGTSTGGHLSAASLDSLLAAALKVRGAKVEVLLCDAALPVCMLCEKHILPDEQALLASGPKPMCRRCAPAGERLYRGLGIPIRHLTDFLTDADRHAATAAAAAAELAEIRSFRYEGIAVGQQALAGTLRFYAVGDLETEPHGEAMLRRYLEAAILTAIAGRRLMAEGFDAVVLHHAIYVPQGVLADVAGAAGARVVAWNTAYRKGCFIFSHGESYHFTLIDEDDRSWRNAAFGPEHRSRMESYLESRRTGSEDWIGYQKSDRAVTVADLRLDASRPTIALMTNIIWDAQLYYASNAFAGMKDWVLDTIRWFGGHPELQLVVRIHPAEIYNPLAARQLMQDEIEKAFPSLPANIRIVPPDDPLNTYALADLADTILIYGTKLGVELAAAGKPVVVAGEAWIRNKGLAYEANSIDEYHDILARLPLGPVHDAEIKERALRYAYHFFFRCMIPVGQTRARSGWPPFEITTERLDDLLPGKDPGLDVVCRGILEGTPFLAPQLFEMEPTDEDRLLRSRVNQRSGVL